MDEVDRKKVTQSRSNSSNEDWTEEQKRTDGPYKGTRLLKGNLSICYRMNNHRIDIISALSASKGEVRATNYSSPIAKVVEQFNAVYYIILIHHILLETYTHKQ